MAKIEDFRGMKKGTLLWMKPCLTAHGELDHYIAYGFEGVDEYSKLVHFTGEDYTVLSSKPEVIYTSQAEMMRDARRDVEEAIARREKILNNLRGTLRTICLTISVCEKEENKKRRK